MSLRTKSPSLIAAIRLRCPHCGETPLLKPNSWFDIATGCEPCDYLFEREEGYFVGSSWMINYTMVALFGIFVATLCVIFTKFNGLMIASITSLSLAIFGILFFPFGNALWIYFDHRFHPLREDEHFQSSKPD